MEPWPVVPEAVALAAAGPAARLATSESATYALGEAATVLVIDAGDRPDGSAVRSFADITLRGPFPRRVAAAFTAAGLILGYARLAEGCLALGRLRVSMYTHAGAAISECRLHLDQRLPFDVLDRVRPAPPLGDLPGLDWLDRLPHDPIGALEGFVVGWYADLSPVGTGTGAGAGVVPEPLRALYRAAAGRRDVLGTFNGLAALGGSDVLDIASTDGVGG